MILYPGSDRNSIVHIRLAPNQDISAQMEQVEEIFEKYAPEYPFDYRFTDVDYARKFSGIKKTEMIARLAGFIVILIACLGLYGLTLYIVQNRLKEVSIRRIFGGSVGSIMKLLGWKSVNPIIWAIILFSPYAWFSMKWWLQSFEYRTTLQVWELLIAAGILLVISILTVGYQIWNTSASNPAEVLRNE
jgi:ABC-type lipoprotein release transport system permease subunit